MKQGTSGIPRVLKTIGWIYLILGIIGAIVIWSTMGTIPTGYSSSDSEPNHFGVALGFISLFQSVVVCVLFQAISLITETLLEIRNKFFQETYKYHQNENVPRPIIITNSGCSEKEGHQNNNTIY